MSSANAVLRSLDRVTRYSLAKSHTLSWRCHSSLTDGVGGVIIAEYKRAEAMCSFASSPPSLPFHRHNRAWLLRLGPPVIVSIVVLLGLYHTSMLLIIGSPSNIGSIPNPVKTPSDVQVSHLWGQYSPYSPVLSNISPDLPITCHFTFAQLLSRHGSRYPTALKSQSYRLLIDRVQTDVQTFVGPYSFLEEYKYRLGAEQLTTYGEQELYLSGKAFYARYENLAKDNLPFIRASGQDRVIRSAENFINGYHKANIADDVGAGSPPSPSIAVVLSEGDGSNNTLSIETCPAFTKAPNVDVGANAKETWAAIFVPAIRDRLNRHLVGANLSIVDAIGLMDLCAFESVAKSKLTPLSPFCALFTVEEWDSYNYYQSLDKYYGHGEGNPLAPTLGVGFVNELIARLTNSPVQDSTSTNHTLDSSNSTFPLYAKLYADFSHDNDMEAIFAALGLYHATDPLPLTSIQDAEHSRGFSAAWTVPFAARTYVEKMTCAGDENEHVRVLVNNRVIPLYACGADNLGRCKLEKFIQSLGFARGGGLWDQCFTS